MMKHTLLRRSQRLSVPLFEDDKPAEKKIEKKVEAEKAPKKIADEKKNIVEKKNDADVKKTLKEDHTVMHVEPDTEVSSSEPVITGDEEFEKEELSEVSTKEEIIAKLEEEILELQALVEKLKSVDGDSEEVEESEEEKDAKKELEF